MAALALLLVAVLTARQVGPSGRGVIVLFTTVASFSMLASSLGANVKARVDLARRTGLTLSEYLGLALWLLLLQVAMTLVIGTIVLSAGHSLYSAVVPSLLCLYGTGLLASVLLRDLLYAFDKPGPASRGDPVGALVLLALIGALALTASTVTLILACFVASSATQVVYLLWEAQSAHLLDSPSRHMRAWGLHVHESLPALVQTLAQAGVIRGDRLILGIMMGTSSAGLYGVAATMTEVLWLLPVSLGNVLFHRISNSTLSYQAQRRIRTYNLLLASGSAACMATLGPAVIKIVFGGEFSGAASPLRILCLAAVLAACYHVDIVRVTASGHLQAAGRVVALSLLITLSLDVFLIHAFGIDGAALASVVGYASLAFGSARAAGRIAA